MNITTLAQNAYTALLAQQPVYITRPEKAPRDGMPLPIKRQKPDADGNTTQAYRPLEILEFVHESLRVDLSAAEKRARAKAKEVEPTEAADADFLDVGLADAA